MSASASKIPKKRHDLLESGLACLVCRHRKTKCDGVRPACGRCRRLGKSCEYAEETSRARVRRLEEIIRSLESEIAALRYNNRTSPIHGVEGARAYLGSPSPRLAISPQLERMQEPHIPEAYPRTIPIFPASILYSNIAFASAEQSLSHPGETYPRVITRAEVERALANWDIQVEMPHRLKDYLLRIFLAHRFQFHSGPLAAKVLGGIRSSPSDGGALQVHPSLVHSMCLLACHVGGGSMSSHEAFLVARTRSDLEMSLAFVDRLVDFLLASTLLGVYFTRTRRYPEAYTTLSGAIRLAIACGLQTLTRAQYQSDTVGLLPPPRNDFEMIEQRHAWFALNVADRILTRESGLPSSLPEDALAEIHRSACGISFQNSPANAFQASNSDWIHHWALTGTSLNPGIFDVSREMDHVCLRARLELLFEGIRLLRAYNGGDAETCSAWGSSVPFWKIFNFLEASLCVYQETMPSLNSDFGLINGECSDLGFGRPILQSQNPNGVTIFPQKPNPALFSVKIIVYAAMISLQNVLLESPCAVAISGGGVITEARQKAVQAANGMAALLKLVISPSASVTGQSQTEAVYSPIPTVYKDVSLLPHVLDASVVMAHEIQRCHISPTNEAEPGRLVGSLELFRTLVIVLRDLGASDPSISIGDEVQRLIGVLPDRIRALLDLSPLASMGHCGS